MCHVKAKSQKSLFLLVDGVEEGLIFCSPGVVFDVFGGWRVAVVIYFGSVTGTRYLTFITVTDSGLTLWFGCVYFKSFGDVVAFLSTN
jgi:hypothetical protein